jgi:hypothetical protein
VVAATSDFSGASVVAIGNFVYYNTSDSNGNQIISDYNTVTGANAAISTAPNFGLYKQNGSLYITGAPGGFGTNHIYVTGLNSDGTLALNPPKDLGADSGSSGPIAFDSAGNLYYAPGFGDTNIYKFSAAEVAAALADPAGHPLSAAGHVWASYGSAYPQPGATSMIVDGNQLLVTLTSFTDPSDLVSFGIDGTGAYNNTATTILSSTDLLGELRSNDGTLYISDGNSIDALATPEPSTWLLMALGLLAVVIVRHKRSAASVAIMALAVVASGVSAVAGPYSPDGDQPGSNGVAANDPSIVEWASTVDSITRGPTDIAIPNSALASYGTPSNALGPSDATQTDPYGVVSLGDGGSITLSFAQPITNGAGADFAVYENGFPQAGVPNSYFLELATVAVSSNGVNFFTFPAISLTQTATQVPGYGTLDPTNLYNLAGSEIAGYGTPFNLDDLIGVSSLLNINDITEVRITDVIGNINPALGPVTLDSQGNPINDPFPTDSTSSGFDLDAVGVIHTLSTPEPATWVLLMLGTIFAGMIGYFHRSRAYGHGRPLDEV